MTVVELAASVDLYDAWARLRLLAAVVAAVAAGTLARGAADCIRELCAEARRAVNEQAVRVEVARLRAELAALRAPPVAAEAGWTPPDGRASVRGSDA